MKLFRSKSCVLKGKSQKSSQPIVNQQPLPNNQTSQQSQQLQSHPSRRYSLQQIKNRSKQKREKQKAYMTVFKQRILNYIEMRSDIEIINFYNEYKQEFFRKSINLQNLLYQKPQIRHKYLSEENSHFFKGFQQTLLNLFRRRVIVPGEFKNMRLETVEEIQKWVFSWVQRQINYERVKQEEEQAIRDTMSVIGQIQQFNAMVQSQKSLF